MKTVIFRDADGTEAVVNYPDNAPVGGNSLEEGVNRGGVTIAGAKTIAEANPNRKAMSFQNTSDADMWLTETGQDAAAGIGFKVGPGVGVNISTNQRVSVYCAAAGKTFAATEL